MHLYIKTGFSDYIVLYYIVLYCLLFAISLILTIFYVFNNTIQKEMKKKKRTNNKKSINIHCFCLFCMIFFSPIFIISLFPLFLSHRPLFIFSVLFFSIVNYCKLTKQGEWVVGCIPFGSSIVHHNLLRITSQSYYYTNISNQ